MQRKSPHDASARTVPILCQKTKAEAEGVEPPTPYGATLFKSAQRTDVHTSQRGPCGWARAGFPH